MTRRCNRVSDYVATIAIIGAFQGTPRILSSQVDTSYETRVLARGLKKRVVVWTPGPVP